MNYTFFFFFFESVIRFSDVQQNNFAGDTVWTRMVELYLNRTNRKSPVAKLKNSWPMSTDQSLLQILLKHICALSRRKCTLPTKMQYFIYAIFYCIYNRAVEVVLDGSGDSRKSLPNRLEPTFTCQAAHLYWFYCAGAGFALSGLTCFCWRGVQEHIQYFFYF